MYSRVNYFPCRRRLRIHSSIRLFHAPTSNHLSLTRQKSLSADDAYNEKVAYNTERSTDQISTSDVGSTVKKTTSNPMQTIRQHSITRKLEDPPLKEHLDLFTGNCHMKLVKNLLERPMSIIPFLERLEARLLQESANLNKAMNLEAELDDEIDFSCLNKKLRSKVYRLVDDYSRFRFLLQQHPLSVPADILLQLRSTLPSIEQFERLTLLRRLVYHQCWSEFWLIAFENTPSLTDVEEVADLLKEQLSTTSSVELSIWRAIMAADNLIGNKRIFQSLCEFVGYRFEIELQDIQDFVTLVNEGINAKTAERFPDPGRKATVILAHLGTLQPDSASNEFILNYLKKHSAVFTIKGFVGELLKLNDDTHVFEFVIQRDNLVFNEADFYHTWQRSNNITLSHSLTAHLSRQLKRESRRNVSITEYVRNSMMNQTEHSGLAIATAELFYESMSVTTLVKLIPILFQTLHGKAILKRMLKKRPSVFLGAFKTYFNNLDEWRRMNSTSAIQEVKSENSTQAPKNLDNKAEREELPLHSHSISQENLLWLIKECRYDCPAIFDRALSQLDANEETAQKLLALRITGHKDLVEVWAYLLRNNLMNQSECVDLFQRIISSSLDLESVGTQASALNRGTDPYMEYLRKCSANDRARLICVLSNLSHSISECEPTVIAQVLNSITGALFPTLSSSHQIFNPERVMVDVESVGERAKMPIAEGSGDSISNNSALQDSIIYGKEASNWLGDNNYDKPDAEFERSPSSARQATRKWKRTNTSTFALFQSEVGKSFLLRRLIRYTLRYVYDSNPGSEGIRRIGEILAAFKYDTQVGQAVVYERIVKFRPQSALEILDKYKDSTSILSPQILNGMEQGILQSDLLSKAQRLRLFESFQAEKIRLNYATEISAETHSIAEKLADNSPNTHERQWRFRSKTRRAKPNIKWRSDRLSYPCVSDIYLI